MDQKIEDVEKVIREYLPNVIHMSLATASDGKPWVCEVHYAYDDDLNIYFRSKISTRHCQEIAKNPNVAGNIVEPHDKSMKPRGVYFEGTAELLTDVKTNDPGCKSYSERFGDSATFLIEDAKSNNGHQFYKISVASWYLFDSRESKPSQKYQLPWSE